MACRVGMAKAVNLQDRIDYWKQEEGHTHSETLHKWKSYDKATALEKSEAKQQGCKNNPGGPRDRAQDWCVYHVWGGR